MTTDPTAAARSARHYQKKKHATMAELAGADILDATIISRAPDGHYVVFLHEGKPLHLVPRDGEGIDEKLDHIIELLSEKAPARVEREPVPEPIKPARKPAIRIPSALTAHDDPKLKSSPANTAWRAVREAMASDAARELTLNDLVSKLSDHVDKTLQSTSFDRAKFEEQTTAMINALKSLHGDDWSNHIPTWKIRE